MQSGEEVAIKLVSFWSLCGDDGNLLPFVVHGYNFCRLKWCLTVRTRVVALIALLILLI